VNIAYEILLMLDPDLPEDRQNEIISRARDLIEKGGGTWQSHDVWGRRRLAYEIDHKPDGAYHLFLFQAEPESLDELARILKITDGVMRHLAVRQVEGGRTSAPPPMPAADDRQPAYAEANTRSREDSSSPEDSEEEQGAD
jgi:small subunit ribosomal protein S6